MAVAPTFASWPIISDIYTKNGRRYVRVRNPNNGREREVRWHVESGFLNKSNENPDEPDQTKPFDMLKHARGFDNGPILIIRNIQTQADEHWCKMSNARYAVGMGWYIVSTETLPADAPKHFKYLLLSWDEFHMAGDERRAKPPAEVEKILAEKERRKEWFNI